MVVYSLGTAGLAEWDGNVGHEKIRASVERADGQCYEELRIGCWLCIYSTYYIEYSELHNE